MCSSLGKYWILNLAFWIRIEWGSVAYIWEETVWKGEWRQNDSLPGAWLNTTLTASRASQPESHQLSQGSHAQEPSSGRKSPECVCILMERPQLSWWSPPVTPDRAQQYSAVSVYEMVIELIWDLILSPNSPALNSDLLDPSTSFHCRDSHPYCWRGLSFNHRR